MTKQPLPRYLVEVSFWTRSHDGDDWITGEHRWSFDTLEEAQAKSLNPFSDGNKGLISSLIYDRIRSDDRKDWELIFKKDWD